MAASSRSDRRRRVARGIYQQSNGRYAVCVMVDGQPRFRTPSAATISEARRRRELFQRVARNGELPISPRLTFAEVAERWLADFEAKVKAGSRRDRTLDLYRSNCIGTLTPPRPSPPGARGRLAAREPALAALDERQPVEALKMSSLPKLAGQSPSGHGAGKTRCPAVNDAWRQASMAGQSAVRRVSVQTPAPYVRVAIA
jgi:hypothetical protein